MQLQPNTKGLKKLIDVFCSNQFNLIGEFILTCVLIVNLYYT